MSAEQAAEPARTYTKVERADKSTVYECNLCPHESPDIDAARAHRAVHVAGPDLLEAAKMLQALDRVGYNPSATTAQGSGYPKAMHKLNAAIAKAEPKG